MARGAGGLLSPPLGAYPGHPQGHQDTGALASPDQPAAHQEDEWKNIQVRTVVRLVEVQVMTLCFQVMLNCILGMVEKTQSALTILQQRQSEAASLRTAEEAVAEVQARANLAIMEVKAAAMEEIRAAQRAGRREEEAKEGAGCWNCGRAGGETCSGCGLARYCGAFCQHKDWEDHARVCR